MEEKKFKYFTYVYIIEKSHHHNVIVLSTKNFFPYFPIIGMMESKEREIKHLNDKVRAMEREYDDLIQKESRERIKADKAEREIANMKNQIDKLEIQREASIVANKDKNNFDSSKFDVEIARYVRFV